MKCTKDRVYQAVMHTILLYDYETINKRMFAVFDSDSVCRIPLMRRRNCVPTVEL